MSSVPWHLHRGVQPAVSGCCLVEMCESQVPDSSFSYTEHLPCDEFILMTPLRVLRIENVISIASVSKMQAAGSISGSSEIISS